MTARDIHHGRGGGRFTPWEPIVAPGPTVVLVCDDGIVPAAHRWQGLAAEVGTPCLLDGAPLRRPNKLDEAIERHEAERRSETSAPTQPERDAGHG